MKKTYRNGTRLYILLFLLSICFTAVFQLAAEETNVFALRRERIRQTVHGRAVLYSNPEHWYLDKNFYYFTGVPWNQCILLITENPGRDFIFTTRANDPASREEASSRSGIPFILPLEQFQVVMAMLPRENCKVYFPFDVSELFEMNSFVHFIMAGFPQYQRCNIKELLKAMRQIKDNSEVETMTRAISITGQGILAAIASTVPGMNESEIQKTIEDTFKALGAEGLSFPSIVGSGPNSVIIHYMDNNRKTEPGDLLVLDVGAQFNQYAGDLTRTIPVSGTFTPRQREVYEVVLEAQRRAIAACQPGAYWGEVEYTAREYIESMGYTKYILHSISHSLGLDVHDPYHYGMPLAPGMIVTIEPGLYIANENLGIRIEDDVLITADGPVVLSAFLPKDPDDIERMMKKK